MVWWAKGASVGALRLPDFHHVRRALRPYAVVGQDLVGGRQHRGAREHQRLVALLIEFDGDEGILEVAEYGNQVFEAAHMRAVDGLDDRPGGARITVGQLVREER